MKRGTHSTVEYLAHRLLRRRVPKWYEGFYDQQSGGFYERLGKGFKPVLTGNRRLLTQCRQLALYSHASLQKECRHFHPDLKRHFCHIVNTYYVTKTGGWRFSADDERQPLDETSDLYALAFVIFSFSHYYRVTRDGKSEILARSTLDFIRNHFRLNGKPGYAEALDENLNPLKKVRRQNPHMHLLEACLFAYETWGDSNYLLEADKMVSLFYEYFFDPEKVLLGEYYDDDLGRDHEKGRVIEPGHYFEWVWLLKKHAAAQEQPDRHDEACALLLKFANEHGWDKEFGGIYDELEASGEVRKDSKRLWPFTEAIKANALMLDNGINKDFLKERMAGMIDLFRRSYMDERGFWTEWLNRDLTPVTNYMPGTTPYHVYFGIMETRAVMNTRGASKSLTIGPAVFFYAIRRWVSSFVRGLKRLAN
jgi:mannose-6-phosphate isomerase